MMIEKSLWRRIKPFRPRIKSNPGRAPTKRHESRYKEQSIAFQATEKNPVTSVGFEPESSG